MVDFDTFAKLVFSDVKRLAPEQGVPFNYDLASRSYKRGVLTVTVGENHGTAFVSYIKPPSAILGHSSNALPFPLTEEGARQAAVAIVNFLGDAFLIS